MSVPWTTLALTLLPSLLLCAGSSQGETPSVGVNQRLQQGYTESRQCPVDLHGLASAVLDSNISCIYGPQSCFYHSIITDGRPSPWMLLQIIYKYT